MGAGESYPDGAHRHAVRCIGTSTLQYSINGGVWQPYAAPLVVDARYQRNDLCLPRCQAARRRRERDGHTHRNAGRHGAFRTDFHWPQYIWTELEQAVVFDLFLREDSEVALTASDFGSGITSIQYYRSEVPLNESELMALLGTGGTTTVCFMRGLKTMCGLFTMGSSLMRRAT